MNTCRVDGCENPVMVKKHALCRTHYHRFKRHGDPLVYKKKRSLCNVDGCDFRVVGNGFCDKHYRRMRRYGTTDAPERITVCTIEGCGLPVQAWTLCELHYRRAKTGRDVVRTCRQCGGTIDPNTKNRRVFCSTECAEQWNYVERRESHRERWLKRYGMTVEGYERMLADQDGRCAICQTDEIPRRGSWIVDHCHDTGRVRGLLCGEYNAGIGLLRDDPELLRKAIAYLTA